MSDDRFEKIEREIETLRERLETFRQASILSRAAIWIGGAVLALVVSVADLYRTPPIVLGSTAAVLGGTVWLGATKASREDTEARLAAAAAQKARLFDEAATRNGWRDVTPTVH